MAAQNFDAFFQTATTPPGESPRSPYDYQRRLACGETRRTTGGDAGTPCQSQLISIPTGLGKTAA